jgi:hypothetical protein
VSAEHVAVLQGVAATAAAANGLFFLRFWQRHRDGLFAYFGAAFLLMAMSWGLLAFTSPTDETRPYVYAIRLLGFLLLIFAMIDKNRRP